MLGKASLPEGGWTLNRLPREAVMTPTGKHSRSIWTILSGTWNDSWACHVHGQKLDFNDCYGSLTAQGNLRFYETSLFFTALWLIEFRELSSKVFPYFELRISLKHIITFKLLPQYTWGHHCTSDFGQRL